MAGRAANGVLGPNDLAPFKLFNAAGRSPFLLIGDHAGSAVPARLGYLGLTPMDLSRHIAIDIGIYGLGHALARLLDAPFLHQHYSRLVIDCNRDPAQEAAIPLVSDGTGIIGNERICAQDRAARVDAIHVPYHDALATMIDARQAAGRDTVLLSLHSFTPVMDGFTRPWHVGVLHWRGRTDFAQAMIDILREDAGLTVGDNAPYRMDDTDYTVPRHTFARDIRYAEMEVRQDLISDQAGQQRWADRLAIAAQTAANRTANGSNEA